METIRIALKDLEQNTGQIPGLPANPRQWTKTEIDRIAKSLRETPELFEARPILVTQYAGKFVILGGNLRFEGCKKNKDKDAPCFIIPDDTPIDKMKEIIIKDNGSFGEWDYDALGNLWDDLPLADWGVPAWDAELKPKQPEVKEDDFDEEANGILVRCKPGDMWQLGEHRLMCGDSTDLETVRKLTGGAKIDMLLTDPPYNVDYSSKNASLNSADKGNRIQEPIIGDRMSDSEFAKFLDGAFGSSASVLKPGGAFYVWTAQGHALLDIASALDRAGLFFRQQIIWVKNHFVLGHMDYQGKHEPCFYGWKEGAGHFFRDTRSETTVILQDKPFRNDLHPTMKPVPLFAQLVSNSTRTGEVVLDPFGGSGTTIIAAEQLNRRCYMMELDPHYCDVILARWEKLTGKKATKIN